LFDEIACYDVASNISPALDGGWSDVRASEDTLNNAVRCGDSDTPAAAAATAPNADTQTASAAAAPTADARAAGAADEMRAVHGDLGRSVQFKPMKLMLKPPGARRLKLRCDI
jgi:hypothetical protein